MSRARKVSVLMIALMLALPAASQASFLIPQAPLNPSKIPQFVTALPTFGDGGPGFVLPTLFANDNLTMRQIDIIETQVKALPDAFYAVLPTAVIVGGTTINPRNGTYVYAYRDPAAAGYTQSWIGPTVLAPRGWRDNVVYVNKISNSLVQKYLTTDQTLAWADLAGLKCNTIAPPPVGLCALPYSGGDVATAVHFHGTESPSAYDGGPDEWFTNNNNASFLPAKKGPAYVTNNFVYENQQEPGTFFYHDHGLGITRLNVYGGMAGGYLILDNNTNVNGTPLGQVAGGTLAAKLPSVLNYPAVNLPPFPTRWIPLVIQDRLFDTNGQLLYPDVGINPEHPFWLPEFFGNVITVNGKSWPYHTVQEDLYRFSIINGSNARVYRLFFQAPGKQAAAAVTPKMYVIGTEQGYLDNAVDITATGLTIATGERYDVVVDFRGFGGKNLILANDAPAPFPAGRKVNPNYDGTIMQFRVVASLIQPPVPTSTAIVAGTNIRAAAATIRRTTTLPRNVKRRLTLNEVIGKGGPLEMLVNNTKYATQGTGDPGNPITELPKVGAVEEWEIINLTADTHPMHPHLVAFQLIDRRPFNVAGYNAVYNAAFQPTATCIGGVYCPGAGPPFQYDIPINGAVGGNPDPTPFYLGPAVPAAGMELGWKDTVRMNPGEVTRILIQFTNQEGGPYSFNAWEGPGYVWHCHIVDHEDNEMMRPFKVVQ